LTRVSPDEIEFKYKDGKSDMTNTTCLTEKKQEPEEGLTMISVLLRYSDKSLMQRSI